MACKQQKSMSHCSKGWTPSTGADTQHRGGHPVPGWTPGTGAGSRHRGGHPAPGRAAGTGAAAGTGVDTQFQGGSQYRGGHPAPGWTPSTRVDTQGGHPVLGWQPVLLGPSSVHRLLTVLFTWRRGSENSVPSLFCKGIYFIHGGSTFGTSSSPEGSTSSNTITLGIRIQCLNLRETQLFRP